MVFFETRHLLFNASDAMAMLIFIAIFTLYFGIVAAVLYPPHHFLSNTICKNKFNKYRADNLTVDAYTELKLICRGPNAEDLTIPIIPNAAQQIIESNIFDPKLKLYIFMCGMFDHPKDGFSRGMIEALENTTGPYNYIMLDYARVSFQYFFDMFKTMYLYSQISDYLADVLVDLYHNDGLIPSKVHMIGMSLGCQIAGRVGRKFFNQTGKKFARITALDSSGPCFDYTDELLSKDDTDYLETIYTNIGVLGSVRETSHISYLPNGGGTFQPGCPLANLCSHIKACEFYMYILRNNSEPFYARKCESWLKFLSGDCNDNDLVVMTNDDTTKTGLYFLKTTNVEPFSMGISGASSNGKNIRKLLLG